MLDIETRQDISSYFRMKINTNILNINAIFQGFIPPSSGIITTTGVDFHSKIEMWMPLSLSELTPHWISLGLTHLGS